MKENEDLREHLTRLTERCGLQDEHHDKARQAGTFSLTRSTSEGYLEWCDGLPPSLLVTPSGLRPCQRRSLPPSGRPLVDSLEWPPSLPAASSDLPPLHWRCVQPPARCPPSLTVLNSSS
jgi:hypothetical protein